MHQERFTALNKSCPFLDNAGHHLSSAALSLQLGSTSGKLTRAGRQYGRRVAAYVSRAVDQIEGDEGKQVLVLMGTAPVHQATCDALTGDRADPDDVEARAAVDAARSWPVMSTSLLNELDGGDCNGMSYDQMRKQFPEVWDAREKDKLNFRYPGAGDRKSTRLNSSH